MTDTVQDTDEALEHLDYLTSSQNRVRVLQALTETTTSSGETSGGQAPRDLLEDTGASEATVSRILSEMQDRGWARRSQEGGYVATGRGELMAAQFDPLHESVDALVNLGRAAELLPTEELTIDLRHFRDATVRQPEGPQPRAATQYLVELLDDSTIYSSMHYTLTPASLQTRWAEAASEGVDVITIIADSLWKHIKADPGLREAQLEIIDAGATAYIYDGYLPCHLFIYDDVVAIADGVEGLDYVFIESGNETVREWALEVHERYREQGEEVTREDLHE